MPFFKDIDRLLRGEATQPSVLRLGRIELPARSLVRAIVLLGGIYGVFMGLFAVVAPNPNWPQLIASVFKVPLLFLLTLMVTFPSLYVFSALSNTKLRPVETLRLLLAALAVCVTLLASFGPVTGFFTLSTDSYSFMLLLNVALFGTSGLVGLWFLRKLLTGVLESERFQSDPIEKTREETAAPREAKNAAFEESEERREDEESGERSDEEDEPADDEDEPTPWPPSGYSTERAKDRSRLPRYAPPSPEAERAKVIFRAWTVIFGVVGAQMAWILRPFVGSPDLPFELFRGGRRSNFFEAVLQTMGSMLQ